MLEAIPKRGMARCLSPGGQLFVTRGDRLTVWDTKTECARCQFQADIGGWTGIAVSPDGENILTESDCLTVWDTATGKEKVTFPYYNQVLHSVAFSPDGRPLATLAIPGAVKLWDIAN